MRKSYWNLREKKGYKWINKSKRWDKISAMNVIISEMYIFYKQNIERLEHQNHEREAYIQELKQENIALAQSQTYLQEQLQLCQHSLQKQMDKAKKYKHERKDFEQKLVQKEFDI